MSQSNQRRVAVIGGGLSGLSVAVHAHRLDPTLDLTVFERQQRVGGVIDTEHVGEYVLDLGADMFSIQPPAAIELLDELGVGHRLCEPEPEGRGAMIVRQGKLVPVPDGFVLMRATKFGSMLRTPLLSPLGKLRMACEPYMPRRAGSTDESVGAFVRRRMGREVLQRVVEPLVAGIYTADVEQLSMRATMPNIVEMEREFGSLSKANRARRRSGQDAVERLSSGARYSQFRSFRGGMVELITSLRDALPAHVVHAGTGIESLTQQAGRWQLTTSHGGCSEYEHVVIATPPTIAASLLKSLSPSVASELAMIRSASAAIAVLVVRNEDIQRPVRTFGFVVPAAENRPILAASFASTKFAGRAPADQTIIRVFMGGIRRPDLLAKSDEDLVEIARRQLGELIGLVGTPKLTRLVRWPRAMPQYEVGHLGRVARIRKAVDDVAGLSLVSNALDGVGIAAVIAAGRRVAEQLRQR